MAGRAHNIYCQASYRSSALTPGLAMLAPPQGPKLEPRAMPALGAPGGEKRAGSPQSILAGGEEDKEDAVPIVGGTNLQTLRSRTEGCSPGKVMGLGNEPVREQGEQKQDLGDLWSGC